MNQSIAQNSNAGLWGGLALWQKVFIGLIAGVVVGAIMGPDAEMLKPIGTLFIHAIKMLIVPLIFCSLVVGVTSMSDPGKMGRVGIKAFVTYLATTGIAISIGIALALLLVPGEGLTLAADAAAIAPKEAPALIDTLLDLIPKNPVNALAAGNVLQIIVFAVILGIALNLVGEKAEPVVKVFEGFAEVMYKMTELVMKLAPYGVFGLMAWVAGKYGMDMLIPLVKVIAVVYIGALIQVFLVFTGLITFVARLNPIPYLKGLLNPAAIAFSTTSSSGTLPATIKASQQSHGVSKGISSFVLPMGATINMDGTAIYQGAAALFVAQAFGIDLTMGDYLVIMLTGTLASIGSAGVPGAGLIMLSLVLTSVGLPLEGVAIIAGIDRILDMARTTTNVCGDMMVSILVGKSENEVDEKVYNSPS